MPVIDHSEQPMPEPTNKRSVRALVSVEHGTESLSISELVVHPGSEGRLHTHDSDEAVMVVEGSIQFVVGDEVRRYGPGTQCSRRLGRLTSWSTIPGSRLGCWLLTLPTGWKRHT